MLSYISVGMARVVVSIQSVSSRYIARGSSVRVRVVVVGPGYD
jgi:hypothetical protein